MTQTSNGRQSGAKRAVITGVTVAFLVALAVLLVLGIRRNSTAGKQTPYTNSTVAMGTVVSQSVYAADESVSAQAVTAINKSINELDQKNLSWRIEDSDVWALNNAGTATINSITADCIAQCLQVSEDTGGLFDVTVGKVTTLWQIGTEDARVPSDKEIQSALAYVNYKDVSVDGTTVTLGEDQFLDLGAVGKGLACDSAQDLLKDTDVTGATVSVGGSVLVYGENPNGEDGSWLIGVRDPFGGENDYCLTLRMASGFISTSGDYEKVLEKDGKTYHHIIDPSTGYPADSNCTGVTVLAPSGLLSDALSTACFILGYSDEALDLLDQYDATAIFVLKDKTIYASSSLMDSLELVNTDCTLTAYD